jgi:hypothetical protein
MLAFEDSANRSRAYVLLEHPIIRFQNMSLLSIYSCT